jgi:tetratricopeptide (TPR) repeat protein
MTVLYTWLPGIIGGEITYFDGLISLSDGALYQNLGILLLLHAFSIVAVIVKDLWKVVRRKAKFNGRFTGAMFGFAVVYAILGILFVKNDRVVELDCSAGAYVIALVMVGAVLFFIVKRMFTAWSAPDAAPQKSAPAKTITSAEAAEEFAKVLAEKDRLTGAGDYASQVPLLTKATELPLSGPDKARLWNYLGIAYERTNSPQRSMTCYQTALKFDRSPSSLSNLALLESDNRNFGTAAQYMDAAIAEAKKRGLGLALYYSNYAYIVGMSGDRAAAQEYLNQAAANGCDAGTIDTIRRKIGLS